MGLKKGRKMKTELTLKKVKCIEEYVGKDIFIVSNQKSWKDMKPLEYGMPVKALVKYKGKHNLERHDLFWACVLLVSENKSMSQVQVVETCKIDARHIEAYTHYIDKNGKSRVNIITKSISFFDMTLQEADEFYSKAFDILAGYIGIETEEMVTEAKLRMKTVHICKICGKRSTDRHHLFSKTKWAIEKYGKDLINHPKNIMYLCNECHASHNKLPNEYVWTEKQFVDVMKKEGLL